MSRRLHTLYTQCTSVVVMICSSLTQKSFTLSSLSLSLSFQLSFFFCLSLCKRHQQKLREKKKKADTNKVCIYMYLISHWSYHRHTNTHCPNGKYKKQEITMDRMTKSIRRRRMLLKYISQERRKCCWNKSALPTIQYI